MNYSRNVRTYYLFSTFADLLILGPILVLFLSDIKGLSFTEIMVLQSISAVSVVLFEVPTGAIADRVGRKASIILYCLFIGISLGLYTFSSSFLIFIIAEIGFSLGASLRSGADSALIYDSLKMVGREKEYQRIEGKARSLSLYAQAFGSVVSSIVYNIHPYLPFIISIGFMIVTAAVSMRFFEPKFKNEGEPESSNYLSQIIDSGKFIIKHEKLKAVVIFCMVFFLFYRSAFWFYQPYMEGVKIPVKFFGLIFFFFNLVAAFVSKRSHYIMDKTKPRTLSFMAGLMIASFLLLALIKIPLGVASILLQQVARGLYSPVTTKYLNKHIPSNKRATILSFQSLLSNLTVAAIFPFMGILKDHTDIYTTHLVLGVSMLVLMIFITGYMNARLGQKNPTNLEKQQEI